MRLCLVVLISLLLLGSGRHLPPLEESEVLRLYGGEFGVECDLVLMMHAGDRWVRVVPKNEDVRIEAGDCWAYTYTVDRPRFAAHCGPGPGVLAEVAPGPPDCKRIFDMVTRRQYGARKVAKYNALFDGG